MSKPVKARELIPVSGSKRDLPQSIVNEYTQDDWMLSFVDIVILLLTTFIMMFAVNQYLQPSIDSDVKVLDPVNRSAETMAEVRSPVQDRRKHLIKGLEDVLKKVGNRDQIKLDVGDKQIDISIGESVLFNTGDAGLLNDGKALISQLMPMFGTGDFQIAVQGFTDNVPIHNQLYPSNWELSAARASGVVRFLIEQDIDENRLSAIGFADTHPVASNDTEQGRSLNRRVNIVLRVTAE